MTFAIWKLDGLAMWEVKSWRYCLLLVITLGLLLPGFGALPALDRDESRFAQASRQMNQSGDFLDIRFQDQPRYQKPIGSYWLQAVSARLTGEHDAIWSYRLPSLLGVLIAVILTAWLGELLFDPRSGFIGALLVAGSVIVGVEARMATTDAALLATVMACQCALAYCFIHRDHARWPIAVLFWGALAASVLIKGPVGPLIVSVTAISLWAIERQGKWMLNLRPLSGLVGLIILVAPWFILIWLESDGRFFTASLGRDFWAKVISGQESKGFPPGYYLGTALITFAPFVLLMISALPWGWQERRQPPVYFLAAWVIPNWLLFELAATKLLHYTMPLLPALAVLTARTLTDYSRFGPSLLRSVISDGASCASGNISQSVSQQRSCTKSVAMGARLGRWSGVLGATAGILTLSAILGAVILTGTVIDWLTIAGLSVTAFGLILAAVKMWSLKVIQSLAVTLVSMAMFYAVTAEHLLPGVDILWPSRQVGKLVSASNRCPETVVASVGYSEPSLVFTLGKVTRLTSPDQAALHLQRDPKCHLLLVEQRWQEAVLSHLPYQPVPVATVSGFNYAKWQSVELELLSAADR